MTNSVRFQPGDVIQHDYNGHVVKRVIVRSYSTFYYWTYLALAQPVDSNDSDGYYDSRNGNDPLFQWEKWEKVGEVDLATLPWVKL
jgi:hypothetical protein